MHPISSNRSLPSISPSLRLEEWFVPAPVSISYLVAYLQGRNARVINTTVLAKIKGDSFQREITYLSNFVLPKRELDA